MNESDRLAQLHAMRVLDTPQEEAFDAIVSAAAALAETPISLLTLLDETRQWFKANVGLEGVSETPRAYAFCEAVVSTGTPLEVPDALADRRFSDNPLVRGTPHIRSYAGFPVVGLEGATLGALCVIDRHPHELAPDQRSALSHLARAASVMLRQRLTMLQSQDAHRADAEEARRLASVATQLGEELRESQQFLQRTGRIAGVGGWELDLCRQRIRWSDQVRRIHDVPEGYEPTLDEALSFYEPEGRAQILAAVDRAVNEGIPYDLEVPFRSATGKRIWVRTVGEVEMENGEPARLAGAFQDVSERHRAVEALESSERRFRQLFQYSLGLICTHDLDGFLLAVNPAAATSLGFELSTILGRNLGEFMPTRRRAELPIYLKRVREERIAVGVLELVGADGQLRYWRYQNILSEDADGPYVLGHAQDVTEQHRYQRMLLDWSTRDPLTQAQNRRYLATLERKAAESVGWGCVVVDLDHFKQVNDTQGHQRGDEILVSVTRYLERCCHPEDVVVRMGGDEFLVVIHDPARVRGVAARITAGQQDAGIGLSVGSAIAQPGDAVDTVIARADEALYTERTIRRRPRG